MQQQKSLTPGQRFRQAMETECPLQIVGAIHPLAALLAQQTGFRALYLSGAGVANASHALPDLGITHLGDVVEDASRITHACDLPLLVDVDTGWGTEGNIERTVRAMERAGVAAIHMEDQVSAKRCGHRPGKALVESQEMQARIRAAVEARSDPSFVLMARTDAVSVEGIGPALERSAAYVEAGADMIFAEAVETLDDYRRFVDEIGVPILANLTEFGRTPYFTLQEMRDTGVRMVLYPLTAFRAMNEAARRTYAAIRQEGSQRSVLHDLQTREQLYELLQYYPAETKSQTSRSRT